MYLNLDYYYQYSSVAETVAGVYEEIVQSPLNIFLSVVLLLLLAYNLALCVANAAEGRARGASGGEEIPVDLNARYEAAQERQRAALIEAQGNKAAKQEDPNHDPNHDDSKEPEGPMKFTLSELRSYDGRNGDLILVSVNHRVYNVSQARRFYGPEGPYGLFAGRDASRALANGDLDPESLQGLEWDSLENFTREQWDSLRGWEGTFAKYPVVGILVPDTDKHSVRKPKASHFGDSEEDIVEH
eukprot:Nk52_evm66s208 gene=Nk52_evmTU66s208